MNRLSLVFLIFILLLHFNQDFSYSQQLDKRNDSSASEEEYLKYEGPNIATTPNMLSASLRMITVLLVLLALFLSVIFLLKKFQQRRSIQSKGAISVLSTLPVGSKESICLVDVMGEILVIGVTSAQISLLLKLENADMLKNLRESQPSSVDQFRDYLKSEQKNIKVATVVESLRSLRDKLKKV